jgi:hypothetical protein
MLLSCFRTHDLFSTFLFQYPNSTDKALHPLCATSASPGMGKSTFIDLVANLTFEQVQQFLPLHLVDLNISSPEYLLVATQQDLDQFYLRFCHSIRVAID